MNLIIGEIQVGIYAQDVLYIFNDHLYNLHKVVLVFHSVHLHKPYWETLHHDLIINKVHNSIAFSLY